MSNFLNPKSSLCPANGRQTVGDGAAAYDNGSEVLAVCQAQGMDDMYYYSTTFSGGPGVYSAARNFPTYAHSISSSPNSFPFSKSPGHYVNSTIPMHSGPRPIPRRINPNLSTPPLTPDVGSDCSSSSDGSINEPDALDILMTLFPEQGFNALPYSKRVSISAPNLGTGFEGVVIELPGKPKTLYVEGKRAASVGLRESIVALLDLADESLGCNALVIALERSSPNLSTLLHSLMYVGGTVVTKPPFKVDPAFVLVGLEI
ncbi:hypothetical protein FA15DRAFT_589974 [Coprinopsis marcescibilis]|uniref:Ornithine decarboxylase antizyme n=1 Tax=Coprinopsis marcescibilis TaxID=230819 RepID=A0A5C3KZ60_COPMA|nr:hypothetical protein FA15DRAFT_589974 [Coprinopsis marcescibilis]